jgi:hypothetical protein
MRFGGGNIILPFARAVPQMTKPDNIPSGMHARFTGFQCCRRYFRGRQRLDRQ